jgi:hypothetical protein
LKCGRETVFGFPRQGSPADFIEIFWHITASLAQRWNRHLEDFGECARLAFTLEEALPGNEFPKDGAG